MKTINWNQMSELGLIEKINRDVLHPLGLAVSRNPDTGVSEAVLIADDGEWKYDAKMLTTIIPTRKIRDLLKTMPTNDASQMNGWVSIDSRMPPKDKGDTHTSIMVDVYGGGERWPDCYYCFWNEVWIDSHLGEEILLNGGITHWKVISTPLEQQK